jgi:hypothetical protein
MQLLKPPTTSEESMTDKPIEVWLLTSEYNDYDQHREYFEALYIGKPSIEQIQKACRVNKIRAARILKGGGRKEWEFHWYNLRQESAEIGGKHD